MYLECPSCGQTLSDLDIICPGCGQPCPTDPPAAEPESPTISTEVAVNPSIETSAPEIESSTTEVAASQSSISETGLYDSQEEPAPKKQGSRLLVAFGAIICLLLVIVICLVVALTTVSEDGLPDVIGNVKSYITSYVAELNYDPDAIAVEVTDSQGNVIAQVTNVEMNYYYWGEYYYFVQNYGYYFDYTQPLDEQEYSDDMTWEDYFLACACTSIQQILSLKAIAEADGYVMSEDYQEQYDATIASMETYALSAGFVDEDGNGDVLAYIQDSYGPDATVESFEAYLYNSYYVTDYTDELYYGGTYTDEEIEAFYDENVELFETYGIEKSETPNVNVRHILICPEDVELDEDASSTEESEAEAAALIDALVKAEEILEEFLAGDATEDSFAELANTYSEDTGSNTVGGLYEDVYPGEMVTAFNDWCFDVSREIGDVEIVETSYGYHIMYFVGYTDTYYWREMAESELRYENYEAVFDIIDEEYTVSMTSDLVLVEPDAVAEIAAEG